MKTIVYTFTLFIFSNSITAQQNNLPLFITDSLENYIKTGMKDWNIPGLSISVVKDGKVLLMKGYGVAKAGSAEPVDENTVFMIGSITKTFTATTLAILQESGALSLNDKVQKWMPDFRLKDTLASREITITDLLSHRMGFRSFQGRFTFSGSNLSRKQVIDKLRLIDAHYGFRSRFGYSNAGFVVAGELIPKVVGKTWEETIRDSILIPLEMQRTFTLPRSLDSVPNRAYPHTLVDGIMTQVPNPAVTFSGTTPAGGMSSCVKDMTTWLLAHLDNGKVNNIQILPANAIQDIRHPVSIGGFDPGYKQVTHFYLYGLGLGVRDHNGKVMHGHTGGVYGFLSSMIFIPEENLGVVILTNNDRNALYVDLSYEIINAFLGLPLENKSKKSLAQYKKSKMKTDSRIDSLKNLVKLNKETSLPLIDFTGSYTNEIYGNIEVNLEKDKLSIYFSNHPKLIGHLEHIQNDNFLCTYSDPMLGIREIPFNIEDNHVTGLTLRVAVLESTPYIFNKN